MYVRSYSLQFMFAVEATVRLLLQTVDNGLGLNIAGYGLALNNAWPLTFALCDSLNDSPTSLTMSAGRLRILVRWYLSVNYKQLLVFPNIFMVYSMLQST